MAGAFATPAGQQSLLRLMVRLHPVITLGAAGGFRLVSKCPQLSGLAGLVGVSYGSQQAMNAAERTAVTWRQFLQQALTDLPVTVT